MPGELAQDEPATFAEEKWRCEAFYAAVNSFIAVTNERFSSSRLVLGAFAIFSPKAFSTFSKVYPATGHVEENVKKFCETYKIDSHRCAVAITVSQQYSNFSSLILLKIKLIMLITVMSVMNFQTVLKIRMMNTELICRASIKPSLIACRFLQTQDTS